MKKDTRTEEELTHEIGRLQHDIDLLKGGSGEKRNRSAESLQLFKSLINLSNDAIFVIAPETGHFLYVNDKACNNLRYGKEELLTMRVVDIEAFFTDNVSWEKHVEEVRKMGAMILEGEHKRKDGTTFPVEVSVKYITEADKGYLVAMTRDITERKNAEDALKREKYQFMNILETIQDGIYIVDQQNKIEYINPVMKKEFGNFAGEKCYEYFHGRTGPCPWCRNEEVFSGKSVTWEFYSEDKHKTYELFDIPMKKADGTISKFEVLHDITERKGAEEKLRQSEERYRTLVEISPHGIQENDTSGIITFSNTAHSRMLGYRREEIQGKAIWDFYSTEEERNYVRQYLEIIVREQPVPVPFFGKNITKDGRVIDIQVDWNYKRDPKGNLNGFISIITDITEYKQAEEAKERLQAQLLHSQKMEAIGRLAGGISHDFGNILTAIKNFSFLGIKRTGDSDPAVRDIFEHISTASFRAIRLTKQLLTFSHKEFTRVVNFDLNQVTNDLLEMLRHLIGEDITIVTDIGTGLWKIRGDSGKLEQVITNLIVNARDAMPAGGMVVIMTGNVVINKELCREIPYARPGRFIRLTIKDTGVGISKENMNHIFEPFFTTKKNGTSSGLGLSVVYGIIKDHNGWINVSSEEGLGTTFEIYLPAIDIAEEERVGDRVSVKDLQGRGERILLVEDDELVLKSMMMTLVEEGYVVFEAESWDTAMEIFQREAGRFHLVISDLVLQDKNGLQLIEELLTINPSLRAILNSGYIDKPIDLSKIEHTGIRFLSKPYDMQNILITIRELLK